MIGVIGLLLLYFTFSNQLAGKALTASGPEILIQNGHFGRVQAIAYSPSKQLFASAGEDYVIKLLDVRSGFLLQNLVGHSGPVNALSFSPDGHYIASGSDDGTVRLWDTASMKVVRPFIGHTSKVQAVVFSPDGRTLASGSGWYGDVSDNSVRLWNVDDGRQITTLAGHKERVTSLVFSHNGKVLVSSSEDGTARVWSSDGTHIKTIENRVYYDNNTKFYNASISSVAIAPDGKALATVSGNIIQIRNLRDGIIVRTIGDADSSANPIAFSSDWSMFVTGGYRGEEIKIWDGWTGRLVKALGKPRVSLETPAAMALTVAEGTSAVALSADKKYVIAADAKGRIRIWDVNVGSLTRTIENYSSSCTSSVFSPGGNLIAWASGNEIKLWDVKNAKMLPPVAGHRHRVNIIAFSPDGKTLVSGADGESVKLWSVTDGRFMRDLGTKDAVYAVAFSGDNKTLATGSGGEHGAAVNLWDWRSSRLLLRLTLNGDEEASLRSPFTNAAFSRPVGTLPAVLSITFSQNQRYLAATSIFGTADVWDLRSGTRLYTLKGHNYSVTSIAFTPDSRTIVSSGTNIKLWEAASGTLINTLDRHSDYINTIAITPDGKKIVSASNDRTIKIWDIGEGTLLRSLEEHASGVNSASFSADGKFLVSASIDTTVKLWSTDTGYLVSTIAPFNDGNWITFSPDNFFSASPGAAKYVSWRTGDKIQEFSKHSSEFNRSKSIVDLMSGLQAPVATAVAVPDEIPVRRSEGVSVAASEERLRESYKAMRYYALVIGNSQYQSRILGKLNTPFRDAEDIRDTLARTFGFKVEPLLNGTRRQILNALDSYKNKPEIDENASVLIYYAGHGEYEDESRVAYWQPIDADPAESASWISADEVINRVRGMKARHILVIADSCFSGGFFEPSLSGPTQEEPVIYLEKMMQRTSRLIMTSGGKEFVDDKGPEGHSVFTHAFLLALRNQKSNIFTADQLFTDVKRYVIYNSSQIPLFGPIRASSRDFTDLGSFVFVRKP